MSLDNSAARRAARHGPRVPVVVLVLGAPVVIVVAALALAAFVFSQAGLSADGAALARLGLPATGGQIQSVRVSGPGGRKVPVTLRGNRLWPQVALRPGETVSVEAVVRRAGWIAWLAGRLQTVRMSLKTPSAQPRERYLTLASGAPLRLAFSQPVRVVAYGSSLRLRRHALAGPQSDVTLPRPSPGGTLRVAAAPRSWESLPAPSVVSWFPAGAGLSAVTNPWPGTHITPETPIVLTFSKPVSAVLGSTWPRIAPAAPGHWSRVDSHTISFTPSGYGFGLGTQVTVQLPGSVHVLTGADPSSQGASSSAVSAETGAPMADASPAASSSASWTVPDGSSARAAQLLAELGYLPLNFTPSTRPVEPNAAAQERAAVDPPTGSFAWRYGNVPASLRALWQPASGNVMLRGAVMAFESAHNLTADGVAGPAVWHSLIAAAIAKQHASGGYSYVSVSESAQSLHLWHDGQTILTTPVNTGIASAPTALGTFPVFEHIASGTMSGTNPDGSHYNDPGVPWISYFNGGDALHGFLRAQYGFPQSLGCVEIPISTAGRVWPYTPVGTLVHVE